MCIDEFCAAQVVDLLKRFRSIMYSIDISNMSAMSANTILPAMQFAIERQLMP